ncbi:MAG: ABC transporter permease, partial [Anaerolineae bacterium]
MRSTQGLIWRNLTAHLLRSILTALAITLGVAMVLAAAIVGTAVNASVADLEATGSPIDLELLARDGGSFEAAVLPTLQSHPDIAQIAPSLELSASSLDISSLTLLGVEPDSYQVLHQLELAGGHFLDSPNSIVLPVSLALANGLYVGDEMVLRVGDGET